MYSNRLECAGGPPEWRGRFRTIEAAGVAARRLCKQDSAYCVETWWGRDGGADGFTGKTKIAIRYAADYRK